ncbi:MAG: hypothetical protein IPH86_19215 [bacterium]|nr:hypothetical protein [bacterium]
MPKWTILTCLLLAATLCHAGECHDYRLPTDSLDLASHVTDEDVRLLAADGDFLCWAGADNSFMTLRWGLAGPDGALLPQGSHRVQRDGADYIGNHLQVSGKRVVVGDHLGGWQVVDFSDPASPTVPWEAPVGTTIGGPVLRGNQLLVPTRSGLAVLDLVAGGPAALRSLVDLVPSRPVYEDAWTMRLAMDGSQCWALVEYPNGSSVAQYLVVVDIADPDAPLVSDALLLGYSDDYFAKTYISLAADGGTAITTRRFRRWSGHPYDFSDTYETMIFTLPESGAPSLVQVDASATCGDAGISGDLAWVIEGRTMRYLERRGGTWYTRQALAVGADGAPRLAASTHAAWSGYGRALRAWAHRIPDASPDLGVAYRTLDGQCISLDVVGDYLITLVYGYSNSDIDPWKIVVLDPADPLRMAAAEIQGPNVWLAYNRVVGDHAYTNGGIYDLTARAWVSSMSPVVFGGTGTALWAWESPDRLVTYDATDPAAPARRSECFAIDGDWWDLPVVASANGVAVFAHGDTLIATDITSPLDPVVTDRLAAPFGGVHAMVMGDSLLYVAHEGGLSVVAVGPAGTLALRGQVSVPASGLYTLALDEHLLYAVTTTGSRLQVFDIADPDLPLLIAEPGAFGYHLVLHDDLLYVAGYSTITALRRQCSLAVPVSLHDLDLAWLADAARLSWRLDGPFTAVRVLARSGHREWTVPWRSENGLSIATDTRAPLGFTVDYAVQVLADNQWLTIAEASLAIPGPALALTAPTPNPFNAETTFSFALDAPGFVELSVLDTAGRVVQTLLAEPRAEGHHQVTWRGDDRNGRPVAAGTYLVRLTAAHGVRTVKAVLVK